MPAPDKADSKPDAKADDTKPDGGAATTAADTSKTNPLGIGQNPTPVTAAGVSTATTEDRPGSVSVVIEQAPAEPAVFYGEGGEQPATADRPHVKADYQPFQW